MELTKLAPEMELLHNNRSKTNNIAIEPHSLLLQSKI